MFGLLLIGGYTAYTTLDIMNRKAKWDNIVKDYNLERDYATILKICGDMTIEDLKKAYDHDIKDAIFNCKKNLKTIPYLTQEDIYAFERKIWSVKAEDYSEKRKNSYEYGKNEMVNLRKKYKNVPRERTTFNHFIGRSSHDDKETLYILMTETYFGEIVYNPKYWDWIDKNMPKGGFYNKDLLRNAPDPCGYTDLHQVWVVDTPDKLWTGSIFNASMAYVKNKKMSARERDYRRKGGLPLKIDEENNKNVESSSDSSLVESTDDDTDDKLKNIQNKFIELKNQGIEIEFEYDNNENLSFNCYGDKHFVFKYSDIAKALEFISDLGSGQDFSKIYNKYQSFVILKL